MVDNGDNQAVEVGMKFRADVDGYITCVFTRALPTRARTLAIYGPARGQKLATATFTSESASGWQEVSFSTRLIKANTTYVVLYHTNTAITPSIPRTLPPP